MSSTEMAGLWPYSERNGVGVERDIDLLLDEPSIELSSEDRRVAEQFAGDLANGQAPAVLRERLKEGEASPGCDASLQQLYEMSTEPYAHVYYTDYFKTPEGQVGAAALANVASQGGLITDYVPQKSGLASKSLKWYKNELTERLLDEDAEATRQPDSAVYFEYSAPDVLLDKFAGLQAYRQLYRKTGRALREAWHEEPTELIGVQKELLALHVERVNGMTAALYPVAVDLAGWLANQPDNPQVMAWRSRLADIAPTASLWQCDETEGNMNRQAAKIDFAWSMDYIRSGAARDVDGTFTPVSGELRTLIDELDSTEEALAPDPTLPSPVIEAMKSKNWLADDLQTFLSEVLRGQGLLSTQIDDWQTARQRNGAADDGLWQVIVGTVGSLEVKGASKVLAVPEKLDRSVLQALAVSAHEFTHVLQAEYAEELAKRVPLAAVKGRRSIAMREAGGIHQERELLAMAGEPRPTNTTYPRAMAAKVDGATMTEAAQAFMEAKKGTPEARARAAGNNILRLYRYDRRGGQDSQALDYAEQELLVRGLARLPQEQQLATVVAGSVFSLRDTARLHRLGLLDLPQTIQERPAKIILDTYLSRLYEGPTQAPQDH